MAANASTVTPAWVANTISMRSRKESLAMAARSPESTVLNGSLSFHSGCSGASAATRSSANASWL
jgi:hypothetical protein